MSNGAPTRIPSDPGRWRAFALAAAVHAALFAFLWFGVNWQNETPVAVEAEVWSPQAREAAPKPQPAPPQPEPEPQPPVRALPPPKAEQQRPAPPPVETPQTKAPDIALEREKKRRIEQERRAEEAADERKQLAREEEQRKEKAQLKAQQLAEQQAEQLEDKKRKTLEQKKLAQAQAQQDAAREADKKRAQAAQQAEALERKKLEDQQKKLAADKQHKAEALADSKAKAAHDEQVRRLTASIDGPTGSGGSGSAAKSQGPRADASYTQKVGAKIKSNTIFSGVDELSNNPAVEIAVDLLPDGSIRSQRKLKSSGVPGFDDAVARAIDKSQPFPPDKSGSVPSSFIVSHRPKDQ